MSHAYFDPDAKHILSTTTRTVTLIVDCLEGGQCTVLLREGFYRAAMNQWFDYKRDSPGTCRITLKNLRELPGDGIWLVGTGGNIAAGKVHARCFEHISSTKFELVITSTN